MGPAEIFNWKYDKSEEKQYDSKHYNPDIQVPASIQINVINRQMRTC